MLLQHLLEVSAHMASVMLCHRELLLPEMSKRKFINTNPGKYRSQMNARYREAIKAKRSYLRESANALIAYLADAVAARKDDAAGVNRSWPGSIRTTGSGTQFS